MGFKRAILAGSLCTALSVAAPSASAADIDKKEDDAEDLKLRPSFAVSSGYASNPDEEVDGEDSAFIRTDAGLEISKKFKRGEIGFAIRGQLVDYFDLADPLRWNYKTKATGDWEVTKEDTLTFEAEREHDALFDPETVDHKANAAWTHKTKDYDFRFRGLFESEDLVLDDDDSDNEFDYVKPALEARLRLMPEAKLSPFVLLRAAIVHHPTQDETLIDRDARDYSVIAGVRWRPNDKFTAEIGGRYNLRELDDVDIPRHDNAFVEANLIWEPSDKFEFELRIERQNDEPSAEGSVVADTTTYEASVTYKPAEKWRLEAIASYEREKEIGGEEVQDTFEYDATAAYGVNDNVDLFVNFRQFYEIDRDFFDDTREETSNTVIRAGVAAKL